MNITLAVPVLNQPEVTQQFLDTIRQNEGSAKLPVLIIDNGSHPPVQTWLKGLREGDFIIQNPLNIGVLPALNQAWHLLKDTTDYIFYTHNDVMILEKNWDDKLLRVLERENNQRDNGDDQGVGVATFYGAKALAQPNIYMIPYEMNQLARFENVSGTDHMDASVHGFRKPTGEVEKVAVADGFSLIVATRLLDQLGGFDTSFPIHHNYDNDICLESLDKGYKNIVISMDVNHLGGRTDVGEDWATPFGKTKQQIHLDAHPVLYNKWRPENITNGKHKICLPVRVQ